MNVVQFLNEYIIENFIKNKPCYINTLKCKCYLDKKNTIILEVIEFIKTR